MGDTESNNELNILGSLIDKIEVNQDERHTEIILVKKY